MLNFQESTVLYSMGSGFASAKEEQNAFDRALLMSGCANYNLVKVSSILPAGAQLVSKINCEEGHLLPVAIAKKVCVPMQEEITIAAAVAVGIPEDRSRCGVIMEWAGMTVAELAQKKVLDMVRTAMEDRGIIEYSTKVLSVEKVSSKSEFVCVIAYVALLFS